MVRFVAYITCRWRSNMHEYKFRGTRVDNGEWAIGDYVYNKVTQKHYIFYSGQKGYGKHEVLPETVGQYIERKDKNNKEIYEGDKLKYSFETKQTIAPPYLESNDPGYEIWEIQYISPSFVKIIVEQDNSYYGELPSKPRSIPLNYLDAIEIIGNIYDKAKGVQHENNS